MTTTYPCQFCGYICHLELDDACPIQDVNKWLAMTACNRCADAKVALRQIMEGDYGGRGISKVCTLWIEAKQKSDSQQAEVQAKVDTALCVLTRRLVKLASDFYRTPGFWDRSLVEAMLERPEKWYAIIRAYIRYCERTTQMNIVKSVMS